MRFALAIAALVGAGVLLVLGIGQRTFLAGPSEVVYPVNLPADADYAVIPAAEFEVVRGQANVVVTGPEGFAATGSSTDIAGWIAPLAHAIVAVDTDEKMLTGDAIPAELPEPPAADGDEEGGEDAAADDEASEESAESAEGDEADEAGQFDPRGSDLWLGEQDGAGRMPVALSETESIIVQAPSGSKVSVVWVQDLRTPLAGPLLVAGGVLAVLGLVLYLLAVDHDRRGLGPRRGRKGPLPGIRGWFAGKNRAASKRSKQGSAAQNSAGQGSSGQGSSEQGSAAQSDTEQSRSGSSERRSLRAAAVPALGLAVALVLSGCSASYWPDFSEESTVEVSPEPTPGSSAAQVPVTQAQIDRIVTDVVAVAREADDARDAGILEARFAGDALAQRTANYQIRSSVGDYEVTLPRIVDEQLDYELVQSTEGWPRTIFVTVASEVPDSGDEAVEDEAAEDDTAGDETAESDGDATAEGETPMERPASPSLAMVLTQESPHENYRVGRLFALRGGISMPPAAPSDEGTALLADDLQTLALPPGEVGDAYAAILAGDTESEQAELFDVENDTVISKSGAAWVAAAQQAASDAGTDVEYSVTAGQSSTPIVSLSTGVGGALVATTVLESRTEKQTGDYQPTAVGAFAALSGLSGRQEQLVSVVAHQLLFFVPSAKSGDRIQLLGYTTELVEAKN